MGPAPTPQLPPPPPSASLEKGKRWCVLFRAVLGWSPEEDSRWVESWNSLRGYGVIAPLLPLFLSFICPIFLCPIFSLGGIIAKISHRFFSSRNVVSNFSGVWLFAAQLGTTTTNRGRSWLLVLGSEL